MLRPLFCLILAFFILPSLRAQMAVAPGDTLYGNEWIESGQTYLKIAVAEDGFYRLTANELAQAGFTLSPANTDRWQIWLRGQQVPLYVDDQGIYFFGQSNRGEMDRFLFANAANDQLNPAYSMYNDTAVYFLGLPQEQSGNEGARFSEIPAGNTSGMSPEPFVTRSTSNVYGDHQNKQFIRTQGISIFYSHYDRAEGYGSRSINDLLSFDGSTVSPFSIELPGLQSGGLAAGISVRFGTGFDTHNQELKVEGQSLASVTLNNWQVSELSSSFIPTSTTVDGSLEGTGGDRDKASLTSIVVNYPAQLDLAGGNGYSFSLTEDATARRLSFTNAAVGTYGLFNLTTQEVQFASESNLNFVVAGGSEPQNYQLVRLGATSSFAGLESIVLNNPLPQESVNFLIVTTERLRGGSDPTQAYAAYRRSPSGGGYRVQVVNVETLYNTHAYGVKRHPLAIRNYQADLRRLHPELRYLFLIGKGREYNDIRTADQLAAADETFFLPSFGLPASDNLISAPVDGIVPALATGRLSVINEAEISLYLNKVQGFDAQVNLGQSLEEKDWLKQIVHLGGGGVASEQQTIRNLLNRMKEEIEHNDFGGNVNSFFKTSSDPIEESREAAIFNRINEGTSIVTFFGHSSSQGFDFNIDNPANYFNEGKYPLMLSLGCYSGDAFTALRSIGERFVFLPEKGAIAFGASKGLGYISVLGQFAKKYYDLLGGELYGQGIGDVLNASINHFRNEGSITIRILLEQFGLNGDPSVRLYPQPGPDLLFDPTVVSFEPRVVPAQLDSFQVKLRIVNIGRGTSDSLNLSLRQRLPGGSEKALGTYRVAAPDYDNEVTLTVPNQGFEAVGPNRLLASIDVNNEVAEFPLPAGENNNELRLNQEDGVPFFVVANTARPAFPPPYALHEGDENVRLTASTTNPLAVEQRYFLQLDTSQLFNDPIATSEVTQTGGVIDWFPTIGWQDSTVYYWRISPDSVNTEGQGLIWNASSFTYLADNQESGWAMAHQGQLNNGKLVNIKSQENVREWNYARNLNDIRIRNLVYDPSDTPDWIYNGQEFASPWPWVTFHGVQVMVLDSINNRDWLRSDGSGAYSSLTHSGTKSPWSFDTRTEAGRAGLMQFIEAGIPAGKYVTLYTAQRGNDLDYGAGDWITDSITLGQTIFGILEAEGAEQVRQLINLGSVPYVFVFQKGVGPLGEVVAQNIDSEADLTVSIAENWSEGSWQSALAGPAQSWEEFSFSFSDRNFTSSDSIRMNLYGLGNPNEAAELLRSETLLTENSLDFAFDLSEVDAANYPYLRLEFGVFDRTERTAATLEQVYFHYLSTPDVAIDPSVAYAGSLDSLQQGETLDLEIGYRNISLRDLDSLLVTLTISGEGGASIVESRRQPPLARQATGMISFSTSAEGLRGNVQVQLQLNPDQDQLEQVIFNNDLLREYFFDRDVINPVLNLYFDGVSIRDGDLVSARPEILMELRDENPYLLLNDTAAFTISLRNPDGSSELIANGDSRIEFQAAANNNDNRARVYFRPELTQDGIYEIRVQAGDRSGNASGRVELVREFEVITEQRVANVFNYPNPFTDQTQFVYTLTGDVPPEVFRIQIMTVSGRVVFDIDLAQQEQLKIGTHRTDYRWDGTDEYGDRLANGVYLYRVITRDANGEALEQHDNGTDQFFKNRMGKLVILR